VRWAFDDEVFEYACAMCWDRLSALQSQSVALVEFAKASRQLVSKRFCKERMKFERRLFNKTLRERLDRFGLEIGWVEEL
jgi:hypothetical protein